MFIAFLLLNFRVLHSSRVSDEKERSSFEAKMNIKEIITLMEIISPKSRYFVLGRMVIMGIDNF